MLKLKRTSVDAAQRRDLRAEEGFPGEVTFFKLGLKEEQVSVDREVKSTTLWAGVAKAWQEGVARGRRGPCSEDNVNVC